LTETIVASMRWNLNIIDLYDLQSIAYVTQFHGFTMTLMRNFIAGVEFIS